MRTRYSRLENASKIGVWGIAISSILALTGIAVQVGADGDSKPDAKPPAATSTPTPAPGNSRTPSSSSTPASPSSAPRSYVMVFEDQTMSLGLPDDDIGSLDFDTPATRRYTDGEWSAMTSNSEQTGTPKEPDLSYSNPVWGYLTLVKGRNAAQLRPESMPATAEDCARSAQVGGFTEAKMSEWKLPPKTVLCIVTDKGNIVRATVARLVGGDSNRRANNAPDQIELSVTLWKPAT
ncbi:hypothetical protein GCM10020367_51310 [Streptomyces sannanensis]|uniref:Secreted protein n=2 Tax=Streptomyces sannanensis TaxID=285536 RepID=A0ABP6SHJ4_9ACTN